MAFPIHVRSRMDVPSMVEDYVSRTIQSRLAKFGTHVRRVSVRFEDVNGPRGGKDTVCRIKIMLDEMDPVVFEHRARAAREALDLATDGVERAVRRAVEREQSRGKRAGAARRAKAKAKASAKTIAKKSAARKKASANPPPEGGSLIGRRVGRREDNLLAAVDRPEKRRRDAYVDTSAPGTSATDRRAGGGSTARRNAKLRAPGATHALEDSAKPRPSRKSTRKSANRMKSGSQLARRAKRAVRSPKARAQRARARATRARARSE